MQAICLRTKRHTSSLRGGILFLIHECDQSAAGFSNFLVRDRTGIKGQVAHPPKNFYGDRLLAHIFKLAVFSARSNDAGCS
jgi:hypothetical protein